MPAVPASIDRTAFVCPHCGTQTTQHWYRIFGDLIYGDRKTPLLIDAAFVQKVKDSSLGRSKEDKEHLKRHLPIFERICFGYPFVGESEKNYDLPQIHNIHVSDCYECHKISIWLYGALLYPAGKTAAMPNSDLPDDIRKDYEEASTILANSPRGAAALLRLAIDKLTTHLGAGGADINSRIASLVAKGLPHEIQQALDAVRVIGNEAVHPGILDLRDDRETASGLFDLVFLIAEDRITRPRKVREMYDRLPEGKKQAIAQRDKSAGK